MFDSQLRDLKELIFVSAIRRLRLAEINPLWFTAVSLVLGLFAALALWQQLKWLGFALWVLNRIADGLDGTIARENDVQTDFGGYADILADFVAYAAIPVGLAAGQATEAAWLAVAVLLATFYVNAASWMYLAAILEKRRHANRDHTTIIMPSGLIGGGETIVFFSLFILFPMWLVPLFSVMSALVLITILQRFIWAKRQLSPD